MKAEAKKIAFTALGVGLGFVIALAGIRTLRDYPVFKQANDVF